jgi:hypothetical protein
MVTIMSKLATHVGALLPPRLRAFLGIRDEPPLFYGLGQCVAALAASSALAANEGYEDAAHLRDSIAHHIETFLPSFYAIDDADTQVVQSIQEQVQRLIAAGNQLQPEETWAIAQQLLATIDEISDLDETDREQYRAGFTESVRLFAIADMISRLT